MLGYFIWAAIHIGLAYMIIKWVPKGIELALKHLKNYIGIGKWST